MKTQNQFTCAWTLTDPDTKQWGRQTDTRTFEFKYGVHGEITEINLEDYKEEEIEDCINSFGYTLYENTDDNLHYIHELYPTSAYWIMAECIFETEVTP